MKSDNKIFNEGKKYLAFLQFEKNYSINTINSYWYDLEKYLIYITDSYKIKDLDNVKLNHIKSYIQSLSTYANNKESSSINRLISSIKSFNVPKAGVFAVKQGKVLARNIKLLISNKL